MLEINCDIDTCTSVLNKSMMCEEIQLNHTRAGSQAESENFAHYYIPFGVGNTHVNHNLTIVNNMIP